MKTFKHLINRYHPIDWLFKSIERGKNVDRNRLDLRENLFGSTEFLVIMSDIAIRVSNNDRITGKIPKHSEYIDFINLYINTQQDKFTSNMLKKYGVVYLSLMTAEQIKFKYPNANLIGRLLALYSHYEKDVLEATGLKLIDLMIIMLVIKIIYDDPKRYVFRAHELTSSELDILNHENIEKFLHYFSITIAEYRNKTIEMGLNNSKLYSFRLIEKYPIIWYGNHNYIVPSFGNLLHSLTNNMYIHLLTHYDGGKAGKTYHESLGNHFEDYVTTLTKEVFDDITRASDIVPKNTENAEFVIFYEDTAIVVEVKKFIFGRDTPYKDNLDELNDLLNRHIKKAFRQIETTFEHVSQSTKIGIIVTFGDINMPTSIHQHMRTQFPDDNIIIASIGSYESLMANHPNHILDILNAYLSKDPNHKGDIIQTLDELNFQRINPYLNKLYEEALDKALKKYQLLEEEEK
jgi:hypothetical protein